MAIITPRLQLLPLAPADILALIDGVHQFEKQFGVPVAEGLRELFVSGDVSPAWIAGLRSATAADPWLHGFALVDQNSRSMIGTAGFKGPPDEAGMVEIGYGVAASQQGRGYATEAAAALVEFASNDGRVGVVRAHTLPTNNASTRVLEKCGFKRLGEVTDPDDGLLVWRWEIANLFATAGSR
jgi:ribosomal-protein-alanine N-acetyltransferase